MCLRIGDVDPYLIHFFFGPNWVQIPNGISIGSAVFAAP